MSFSAASLFVSERSTRQLRCQGINRAISQSDAIGLYWFEKILLLIGIVEIPLQIDKYFYYHESDGLLGAVGGFVISPTFFATCLLYGIWIADASLHRRRLLSRPVFGLPMLIYMATVLLSVVAATKPILSIFDLFLLFQSYLLFFFIANRIQTQSDLQFVVLTLAVAILAESGFIFWAALIGMFDERIDIGPISLVVQEGRHGGTMHSPVLAGSTLALIWLPVAASLFVIRNKVLWSFHLVVTLAGMLAILMTQTRGAILTSAIGSVIIISGLFSRGWLPKWALILAVLLAAISFYPLIIVYENRIRYGDGDSAVSRKHLSLIAFELIQQRPILGHGSGNCHIAGQRVADQGSYRGDWYFTIHSKYLLVWVETGLVGLIAFLSMLGNAARQGLRTWSVRSRTVSVLGLACVAALVGHMTHMAVDIFNSRIQVQLLWIVLGLTAACYKMTHPDVFSFRPLQGHAGKCAVVERGSA